MYCKCIRVSRRDLLHFCMEIPANLPVLARTAYPGAPFQASILESNGIVTQILLERPPAPGVVAHRLFAVYWTPARSATLSRAEITRATPSFYRLFQQRYPVYEDRPVIGTHIGATFTIFFFVQ